FPITFFFQQNISGFQVAGLASLSDNFKLGYNGTIGTYDYINHFEGGVLGLQAQEDAYPLFGYYDTEEDKINQYLCGTGRIYGKFFDKVTLGANYFTGDAQQVTYDEATDIFTYYPSTKYTYGFDFHIDVNNIKFNAEYWAGEQNLKPESEAILGKIKKKYEGYYGEIIYDGDIIKPFFKI
ncbi:MAG: hypothetical protein HC831_15935, partial [Chloroflexia bacterium]|nr:hypothetical protein [Chloroflexia bacterium]